MSQYYRFKRLFFAGVGVMLLGLLGSLPLLAQAPIDNSFTYQGRLLKNSSFVDGSCHFRFRLYDGPDPAATLLGTQTISTVTITEGYFTVTLNDSDQFGASTFSGNKRYLAVEVQCSGDTDFVVLDSKRIELTALPYAVYAQNVSWTNISNRPPGLDDGDTIYTAGFGLSLDTNNKFDIDDNTIQRRIGSQCSTNEAIRSILSDGTVTCENVAQFGAELGLILDSNTNKFRVDFNTVQRRLQSACQVGEAIRGINSNGDATCQSAVTNIVAGNGLDSSPSTIIGGINNPSGTINVATGGITTAMLANSAVVKDKIVNNAIDTSKIENKSIKSEDIGADCTSGHVLKSQGSNTWDCAADSVDGGNADLLDNLDSSRFLRRDTGDQYTSGTLVFNSGTILDIQGALEVKGGTVFNSRPAFDGGTSGFQPPFTVDSNFLVNNFNADLLDGNQGSFYQNADNLSSGTVSTTRYSAQADLAIEGYLGNAADDIAQNNGVVQSTLNADLLDGQDSTAFVSNSRAVNTSTGLTGGGDLSVDRTLNVDFGSGANQAARGNHDHLSQTWIGSGATGLTIEMTDSAPALVVQNNGTGPIFEANAGANRRFYIDGNGDVFADGGYNCGPTNQISTAAVTDTTNAAISVIDSLGTCLQDGNPADFAEMLPAASQADQPLEPGDVLVIGPDGQLTRSTEGHQTSVVGVYSTRPSYLGNSRFAGQDGYAPLAIVGVVPVKASAENGPIQPGDMLVASATPGHAMRAKPLTLNGITFYPSGVSIGKALEPLDEETGLIQMLVTLQ